MSGTPCVTEKKNIIELLEMYKNRRCLWDQTHLKYNNKEARNLANEELLEKYRTVYEDATMKMFKKRIENMRAAVRRERKKILSSILKVGETTYTPRLWYFKHMKFLESQFTNDSSRCTDQSTDGEDNEEEISDETKLVETHSRKLQLNEEFDGESQELEAEIYDIEEDEPKPKRPNLTAIYMSNAIPKQNDVHSTRPDLTEEESETYGRAVGLQLKQLDGFQRTVAQKLISDTIFYARLNKLSANSSINLNADKYN